MKFFLLVRSALWRIAYAIDRSAWNSRAINILTWTLLVCAAGSIVIVAIDTFFRPNDN
jgi:hypothetical protein